MEAFKTLELKQHHDTFWKMGKRADGRESFDAFRELAISQNPIDTSDGSCICRLGNTTVICGIKATINTAPSVQLSTGDESIQDGEPDDGSLETKGTIEVNVDLPPNIALGQFKWNREYLADQNEIMSSKLAEVLKQSECIDLKSLVVADGKLFWTLNIDVVCVDFDGNFLDTALIAINSCLSSCKLPEVSFDGTKAPSHGQVVFHESKQHGLKINSYPLSTSCSLISFGHHPDRRNTRRRVPFRVDQVSLPHHQPSAWDNHQDFPKTVDPDYLMTSWWNHWTRPSVEPNL